MKRIIIIIIMCCVSIAIMNSGCTCYMCDSEARGCGAECLWFCSRCSFATSCTQTNIMKKRAEEGIDYTEKQLKFSNDNGTMQIRLSFKAYAKFWLDMKICVCQDGKLLKELSEHTMVEKGEYLFKQTFTCSEYDPNGGEIYYFINEFETALY